MNLNIHLPDDLVCAVTRLAKKANKTRNELIAEAVRDFVKRQVNKSWPDEVRQLVGMYPDLQPFESIRRGDN